MRRRHLPAPSSTALARGLWLVLVATIGLVVYLLVTVLQLSGNDAAFQEADQLSATERASLFDMVEEERTKRRLLTEQVEGLGEEPVVDDELTLLDPLPRVSLPPTMSQVMAAVNANLGSALRAACDGSCRGEDGETLPPADPLPPSAPLPPLPPADPIPGKDGKDGKDGADGSDGKDGRGVERFDCIDGAVVATFTDGTTQTVPGLTCIPTPPPPEPEPMPTE